jgi:protein TonB
LIQASAVALLILIPLFGKTERIAVGKTYTPIPPYGHHNPPGDPTSSRPVHPPNPGGRFFYSSSAARPASPTNAQESPTGAPEIGPGGNQEGSGPECSWCIDIGGKSSGPRPPQPTVERPSKPQVVRQTTIDPAMLIRRVDPVYPTLPKQIHKEGRVELRAIIATDGSIKSLEVVGGDPMFYQSALEAVSQWHYKPTILNGQAVEVDTHITVIYTMPH